jgi:23S rRNA (adenine2503-C2)-methyltransferase
MPINKKYPIAKLMDACRKFAEQTGRYRITFEYVMCRGVNDSIEDAQRLVRLISRIPSKINLIPVNAFQKCGFENPSNDRVEKFADYLREKNVQVNIRASHGQEILAACGQLASK